MGYVRTAGMSTAARRRRRRTAMVLTALVALLAVVLTYSFAYYQGWLPGSDAARSPSGDQVTTSAPVPQELQPEDVMVNVYNATQRAGLAGTTAEALATYGFSIDQIANDPERASVSLIDIRHGPAGEEGAQLLLAVLPDATLVPDARESASVDLVLGRNFTELLPEGEEPADEG